jgi:hypothetical protein
MQNGTSVFSDVRVISFDKKLITILYPNPVQNNSVYLYTQSSFPSQIHVDVFDISGRLLYKKEWQNNSFISVQQISLPGWLLSGLYLVKVSSGDQRNTVKLVKF